MRSPVVALSDRRDAAETAALRDRFLELAAQAFDFGLLFMAHARRGVTVSVPSTGPHLLKSREAAERLKCSLSSLDAMRRSGRIPASAIVIRPSPTGGKRPQVRYVASAIDALDITAH